MARAQKGHKRARKRGEKHGVSKSVPGRRRIPGLRSPLGLGRGSASDSGADRVQVEAIPFLPGKYEIQGAAEIALIGDAPKDYIVYKTGGLVTKAYIAKKPRVEGPIECVTEYLISQIGATLPLRVAEGELAQLPVKKGETPDVRFLSRQFLDLPAGEQLVHGSQLVARCFEMKEEELSGQLGQGKEWLFYTIDLLDEIFESSASKPADALGLKAAFARMMAFDALIGANDRHPQNWGVIENAMRAGSPRFSPIFDTARGLFWNHSEERLSGAAGASRQEFIERYARHSAPLIGVKGSGSQPNHFSVVAALIAKGEPYKSNVRRVIRAFDSDVVARRLHLKFRRLLTRCRLELISDLLRFRHAVLSGL